MLQTFKPTYRTSTPQEAERLEARVKEPIILLNKHTSSEESIEVAIELAVGKLEDPDIVLNVIPRFTPLPALTHFSEGAKLTIAIIPQTPYYQLEIDKNTYLIYYKPM